MTDRSGHRATRSDTGDRQKVRAIVDLRSPALVTELREAGIDVVGVAGCVVTSGSTASARSNAYVFSCFLERATRCDGSPVDSASFVLDVAKTMIDVAPTLPSFDEHEGTDLEGVTGEVRRIAHRAPAQQAVEMGLQVPKVRVEVTKGVIEVNSASLVRATPDVVWIHVDTKQKYPDLGAVGEFQAWLGTDEDTLGVTDASLPDTEITVVGLEGDWKLFAETGRYYLNMVFVRAVGSEPVDVLVDADATTEG